MKTILTFLSITLLVITATAQKPQTKGEAFEAVKSSINGLMWSTETDDNFKPFFVRFVKGETPEAALKKWAARFPKDVKPEYLDVSEYGHDGFEAFIAI